MPKAQVNGEERVLDDGTTIAQLIDSLGLGGKRVAVEHNREVADRELWATTTIAEGDNLEIVHFVGGG